MARANAAETHTGCLAIKCAVDDDDDDDDGDDADFYGASEIDTEATLSNARKTRKDSMKIHTHKNYRKDKSRMSFGAQGKMESYQ